MYSNILFVTFYFTLATGLYARIYLPHTYYILVNCFYAIFFFPSLLPASINADLPKKTTLISISEIPANLSMEIANFFLD